MAPLTVRKKKKKENEELLKKTVIPLTHCGNVE